MYLQPQPDLFANLHPQISESTFQSQLFAFSIEQVDGSGWGFCSDSTDEVISVRFVIGDESKCGDKDCIRGKSISIILNSLVFYFLQYKRKPENKMRVILLN